MKYESRLPNQLNARTIGHEVLVAQTRHGVPAGYGHDRQMEELHGPFENVQAAEVFLASRGWHRDERSVRLIAACWVAEANGGVINRTYHVQRCTRVGFCTDTYEVFNA